MTSIALIGNPNTGKTTLFNSLTDKYAVVGNWTGVTVDKKVGTLKHSNIEVVDLPGAYSLNPLTKDEAVVAKYLLTNRPDLILNITNASQLKRNLLLTIEVLERGLPLILILNMIDDLRRSGQSYDLDLISRRLGCKVLTTNARGHQGIKELHQQITDYQEVPAPKLRLDYPLMLQQAIRQAAEALEADFDYPATVARWLAIQFIDQIYNTRLVFIESLLHDAQQQPAKTDSGQLTAKIDQVVTNPVLGLPIFAGIFYLMFKLSFEWVGTPLSDALDWFLSVPVSNTVDHWLLQLGVMAPLRSLIVNGLIAGVGGVLAFIPQIFTLFACISLLEDSGYMARAALVTDRLMQMIGLNGKSFIPLIIGFGCNVTGIMAARTVEQPKERLVTTLIMPFMSCSARLPIYGLVVAAFFPHHQALVVLSIYFLGIVVALLVAKLYQLLFRVKERSVFIIELPEYHLPRFDVTWHGTWDKGKGFIKKAGTIIFAGTVLIWLLSSFGPTGFVTDSTRSFAAALGHGLVPFFRPLGIVQWQAISALFTGVLAKEVITSSMIVMFHTSSKAVLIAALGQFMTPVAAYSLLAFVLLYIPCFATLATIKEETGSFKWVLFAVVSGLAIAYCTSFLIFQIGLLIF